jgi:hypothetical protein
VLTMAKQQVPEELEAVFTYATTDVTPRGRQLDEPALRTRCVLWDNDRPVAAGDALLSPWDSFDESLAQEISLGRALKRLAKGDTLPRFLEMGQIDGSR